MGVAFASMEIDLKAWKRSVKCVYFHGTTFIFHISWNPPVVEGVRPLDRHIVVTRCAVHDLYCYTCNWFIFR